MGAAAAVSRESARASQASPYLTISGTVTYEHTGQPVRGALIVVEANRERRVGTDTAGRYRIDSLPYRSYFVQVRAVGQIIERREVRVGCSVAVTGERGKILTPSRCVAPDQVLNFTLRPDIPW